MSVRPKAMRDAMARDCALVIENSGIDDTRVEIYEIRQDDAGVVVVYRCWWFDEEAGAWALDGASEWYLSDGQAASLGDALVRGARQG